MDDITILAMDLLILAVVIWVGCFLVVAIDSAYRRISPWFWRLATLFGGPFALLAYSLVRERGKQQ
jgi:drug/metabolite transporter (DMT)-like permease